MKKLSYLFLIVFLSTTFLVKAGVPDYIVTGEEIEYYEKVRYGISASLVGVKDSNRDRFKSCDVSEFRKNGKVYERMPVIRDNKETGRYTFMEVVSYRNGLKVYRYYHPGITTQDYELLVFKGDQFVVKFDEKNSLSLSNFFFNPEYNNLATMR
ncbi:MAG: hypothetical protein ACFCUM_11935 [Bacteroidales bacterium]